MLRAFLIAHRGPLALAGSTGGLARLLSGVAKEAVFGEPSGFGPSCPIPSLESDPWEHLLVGILLGPLLDLAFILRVQLLRQVRRRLGNSACWYRLVDE